MRLCLFATLSLLYSHGHRATLAIVVERAATTKKGNFYAENLALKLLSSFSFLLNPFSKGYPKGKNENEKDREKSKSIRKWLSLKPPSFQRLKNLVGAAAFETRKSQLVLVVLKQFAWHCCHRTMTKKLDYSYGGCCFFCKCNQIKFEQSHETKFNLLFYCTLLEWRWRGENFARQKKY